jgi:hypothetical protein
MTISRKDSGYELGLSPKGNLKKCRNNSKLNIQTINTNKDMSNGLKASANKSIVFIIYAS